MTPEQREAALRHELDSICNALQYDLSGKWGVETIGPIREAIDLLRELAAEPDHMDELRKACAELLGNDPETWPSHGNAPLAIAASMAILCKAAEPVQEPVAWLSRDEARLALWKAMTQRAFGNPTDDKLVLEALRKDGLWIGHLDAAPQQRKPLTDKEIMNTLKAQGTGIHWRLYVETVRAVERAHCITGEPT